MNSKEKAIVLDVAWDTICGYHDRENIALNPDDARIEPNEDGGYWVSAWIFVDQNDIDAKKAKEVDND